MTPWSVGTKPRQQDTHRAWHLTGGETIVKILQTQNLILRHFEAGDLNDLFRLYSDPDVRRYFPDGTRDLAYTKEELEWYLNGHPDHPELGLWATIHKASGQFIGRCGLLPWTIDGRFEVEVAYLLDQAYWGRGLGTEAAQGVLDYGFAQLGLPRLVCLIERENLASIRVAEKIGMAFEKEGCDEHGPFLLYVRSNPKNGRG
jgi:ribosomal-protein-alanine N-acetyltransferase